MILESDLTRIGRLLKPHGINGEISMMLAGDVSPEEFRCVMLRLDGIFVPFFIESVRPKSSETDLITLQGVADEKAAAELCGHDVYALTAELPNYDEGDDEGFYAADLVGLEAWADGEKLGKIISIDDSTDNYLFIIERADGKGQLMVPVAEEFISSLDFDTRRIAFELPEGLLDL